MYPLDGLGRVKQRLNLEIDPLLPHPFKELGILDVEDPHKISTGLLFLASTVAYFGVYSIIL